MDLKKEIEHVINRASAENKSNTPDFILAKYLTDCLEAFNEAANRRSQWYEEAPKWPDGEIQIPVRKERGGK